MARLVPDLGLFAGFIVNWGVHHLDIANWGCPPLGSEPFELKCQAGYRKEGFTDNSETWSAVFTYPDGLKMIYKDNSQQKTGTRFIGEQGWVHVDRGNLGGARVVTQGQAQTQ